jgi:CYTH domain-containing protein
MQFEKERRYLIELPLKWYGKFRVLTAQKTRIYQTYLNEPSIENSRVRAIMHFGRFNGAYSPMTYTYTKKMYVSAGINKEYENNISDWEYRAKLDKADKTKNRIVKCRYIIDFDCRKFELDIFEEQLLGLGILEIELEDINEKILLPPYLKVLKEITNDRWYNNINLANINSYQDTITAARYTRRND